MALLSSSSPRRWFENSGSVLRLTLVLVSALVVIAAIAALVAGVGPGTVALVWLGIEAAIVLLALVGERGRYRPRPTGTDWIRTSERFQDPVTGRWTVVEYDAKTGERRYVEE